jgi:hypothetical protein
LASKRDKNAKRKADAEAQAKRDSAATCGAAKRNGEPCGRDAGWGTDHPGTGRCKMHTGSTRAGQIAAATQELGMAKPANITPGQALQGVMTLAAGQLLFATDKVSALDEDKLFVKGNKLDSGAFEMIPHKWVELQRQCMDRLAKYAKLAADAGIAERQTQLQETQMQLITQLMEAVFDEIGLSKRQRAAVGPAIRRHLTLLPGGMEQAA